MRLNDDLATLNQGDYFDPFAGFSLVVADRFTSDFEALTAAVFAEVDIDVGDRGLLTAGLRAERRTTDYRDSAALSLEPAESMLGGELRYRYDIDERTSAFAALTRGYKAGGFNLGVVPADRREFVQEALWNAELGLRSSSLDDALTVSGLIFANRRSDQQVRTSFQLVPNDPASFVFYTDNAASGRSMGLEAELSYRANDSLRFDFSAGLLHAEFDEFRTPQVDLSGRDQAHAPRYTLSAAVEWQAPSGWFARLDAHARDKFYFDVSHDQQSQSYELLNGRVGYAAEQWKLQLWARNLLDERYAVRGFFFGNEPPDFPETVYVRQGDPRQLGLTFDWSF
jgi:outer membrane receptor protein involved in Fe transport